MCGHHHAGKAARERERFPHSTELNYLICTAKQGKNKSNRCHKVSCTCLSPIVMVTLKKLLLFVATEQLQINNYKMSLCQSTVSPKGHRNVCWCFLVCLVL